MILWWESRRLLYNLVVGTTGLISLVGCFASAVIGEAKFGGPVGLPEPLFAFFGMFFYAVLANLCYTSGWIVELAAAHYWGQERSGHFGQVAFALGLLFSIALTLAPLPLLALVCMVISVFGAPAGHPQ